jgi:glycosyltransferase involved in cell wall biosynthesis
MESDATLRRCIESIRDQTYQNTRHYLVADGHPRRTITQNYSDLSLIDLPVSHSDIGNTPRCIGAICALSEGAEIVCFLDADNLYEPDHVSSLVATYEKAEAGGQPLDAVFAYRHVFLPGHEDLRLVDVEDISHSHVDTSCISLSRSASFLIPMWSQIPKKVIPISDVVMLELIKLNQLRMAWTGKHTVRYESNWSAHYRQAGLSVPTEELHDHICEGVCLEDARRAAEMMSRHPLTG